MCPHCCNTVPGGCIHCRGEKLETGRRAKQSRHRLTDAQRREFGLVCGRLYSPPQGARTVLSAAPTHHRDRKLVALRKEFGSSVLPLDFVLP